MSFQWLQMRITEEKERREREDAILNRLPTALEEIRLQLAECVDAFNAAFACGEARLEMVQGAIHVTSGEARVEVSIDAALPGFRVAQRPNQFSIEVGLLPGNRLYFRDAEKYLTVEEMTRRILDKALFPKLGD
jgi:hypothetical protein